MSGANRAPAVNPVPDFEKPRCARPGCLSG